MPRQTIRTPFVQAVTITGASIILGLLFDAFFFDHLPGLSFPLYIAGLAVSIWSLTSYLHQKPQATAWWLTLPLLGFASMVAIRSSEPLTLMNLGACLLLLLLIAKVAFRRRLADLRVKELIRIPFLPLQFLKPARHTIEQIIATHQILKTQPMARQVIKGIALTIPILIVFLVLFASADLIVQKYLAGLISIQLDPELTVRLILILFATLGLIGGYSYMFNSSAPEETSPETPSRSLIGTVESTILLTSINALFFAFILVQLAYLFGGQANISALGFTYAQYARKGFFELLVVAIVAFGVLWSAEKYVKKTEREHSMLFKALATTLIVQVIMVMGSAFRRLYLYEQAYGFTALRLYSHAFTVLLAIIFVILAYKIIRSASDQAFALPMLLAVMTFLAAMNWINPDAFIARQNLDRYHTTGKIDTSYLGQLSDDAVPTLIGEYSSLQPNDATALGKQLNRRWLKINSKADQSWQSWNYSRTTANAALAEEAPKLQEYPLIQAR